MEKNRLTTDIAEMVRLLMTDIAEMVRRLGFETVNI
jgi:hypothetical protein